MHPFAPAPERALLEQAPAVPVLARVQTLLDQGLPPVPKTRSHVVARAYEVTGELDIDRLEAGIGLLWRAHDALRQQLALVADGTAVMTAVPSATPTPLRRLQIPDYDGERLPACVAALTRSTASQWAAASPGSAAWALLRITPEHHVVIAWSAYLALDARSHVITERQLWAYYFDPSQRPVGGSYLSCAAERRDAGERNHDAYWAAQLRRVPERPGPAAGGALADETWEMGAESRAALATSASAMGLTLPQLLGDRFARCVVDVMGGCAVVHHHVDERSPGEQDVVGNFGSVVPVVVGPDDLPAATGVSRRVVRALASRPRSAVGRPGGFRALVQAAHPFTYYYLPARFGPELQPPAGSVTVTEVPAPVTVIDDPNRMRLRVLETINGGLSLLLSYHLGDIPAERAREVLQVVCTGEPRRLIA